MSIGIIVRNKVIFALNYFVKQNRIILIILILNVSVITKSFGKLLSLISVTKG